MKRLQCLTALTGAAALAVAAPAFAHPELVRSTPSANVTVTSPRTITLTFNERVVPAFTKLELTMPAHNMKLRVTTRVSRDGKQVVGTVGSRLAKGSYRLTWTAAGDDGHKVTGRVNFKVG